MQIFCVAAALTKKPLCGVRREQEGRKSPTLCHLERRALSLSQDDTTSDPHLDKNKPQSKHNMPVCRGQQSTGLVFGRRWNILVVVLMFGLLNFDQLFT